MDKEGFIKRLHGTNVYYWPHVDWKEISRFLESVKISPTHRTKYFEVPVSFDIETTSFETDTAKCACMYAWGYSIGGYVILGRTWEAAIEVYEKLAEILKTSNSRRLLIYIQNLAYEFQFFCHRFEWERVFALKKHKPISCVTTDGIEFRCSYLLSGFALAKMGENLQRYKVKKLVGDLDYSKKRHPETPLTDKEWGYLINDVQVVVAYIQECIENDKGIHKIPLTKTGYVRNYCREKAFEDRYYRKLMKVLTLEPDEYRQLKRAFAGGYTHANWKWAKQTIYDMDSFDFTSSYPYTMVSEKFPMSKGERVNPTVDEFYAYLESHCCLFDITLYDVDGWDAPDHILSKAKCATLDSDEKLAVNNGRIITASIVKTTMTEVDFKAVSKFYKFKFTIENMRIYRKDYLPTSFVTAILKLYQDKTELKDVEGKEVEYMKSKGMINSAYGMAVTDIVRDEDTFSTKWECKKPDDAEAIEKYNNNKKRFLFYPWGVWVTAYARSNLYSGILEFGNDYVYSDTDSIKAVNAKNHQKYIDEYNLEVAEKLKAACAVHRIPYSYTSPKTIKGKEKPLGVWDYDGHYRRFKTLGAKRYMTEALNRETGEYEVNITVAGLNKKTAVPYISRIAREKGLSEFDVFDENLYVPGEVDREYEPGEDVEGTGKMTHTYNDEEFSAYLEDYLGNVAIVHEYSCIHLEPAEYSLSMCAEYLDLLRGITYEKR